MERDRAFWHGDDESQALVTEAGGRLLALVHHDGNGKYHVTIYPSVFSGAFWSMIGDEFATSWSLRDYRSARWNWLNHIRGFGWRSFPHIRLLIGDYKGGMPRACDYAADLIDIVPD